MIMGKGKGGIAVEVCWTLGSLQYVTHRRIIGSWINWDHNSASPLRMSPMSSFIGPDLEGENCHASTTIQGGMPVGS